MAAVVVAFPTEAVADHHSKDTSGHVVKSEFQECMWMHAHISKPSNNVNEFRFRPYIASRATMDHGVKAFTGQTIQCWQKDYEAPGGAITLAEHLGVWAWWMNNRQGGWLWCNNGPEIQNGGFAHEVYTEWWWWAFPCQDIADSAWFFNRAYYRGQTSFGTHERILQTEWLYAAGP